MDISTKKKYDYGMLEVIVPSLLLGLAGSLHCVGMCGPIALALVPGAPARRAAAWQSLAYNAGRVSTYAALGGLFGLLGKGLELAGIQQVISVAVGFLMLGMAFLAFNVEHKILKFNAFFRFSNEVKSRLARLLRSKAAGSSFSIGLLNGLLPCGLVYAAIAGAIAAGGVGEGAVFMVMFGIGTVPLMLGLPLAGAVLGQKTRLRLQRVRPALLILVGLIMIYRGLNLDLSLFEMAVPPADYDCH